jgi:hypothetical protein
MFSISINNFLGKSYQKLQTHPTLYVLLTPPCPCILPTPRPTYQAPALAAFIHIILIKIDLISLNLSLND